MAQGTQCLHVIWNTWGRWSWNVNMYLTQIQRHDSHFEEITCHKLIKTMSAHMTGWMIGKWICNISWGEKWLMVWVNCDLDVYILQVHLGYPIHWMEEIREEIKALHLEVFLPHKLVEVLHIYFRPLTPILLFYQEYLGHTVLWRELSLHNCPFG